MDATNVNGGIVRLNVGGKLFETTVQTLCKEPDSFLARFCEIDGMQPRVKDASGAFFIDRDPRYFRVILNYLRSSSVDLEGNISLETLLAEADFYCLRGLAKRLEDMRSSSMAKE
ncbi:BTB/POZ domain-containing protein KCTD17 [Aphelenchoides avenae]|nr:BTB/POZ domain-containing protein KCTD17 [Aphelenchus avenae]